MTSAEPDDTPEESSPEGEPEERWTETRFEVVAVVILSLAALATAWSGYQASLWDGIQSSKYTQASAARTTAAQLRTEANQYRLGDLSVFENYIDARILGEDGVAEFYETRFRDEFRPAYDAWIALDPLNNPAAPASPMAMPEYVLAADTEAAASEANAEQLFNEGEESNNISDVYTLTTLLFAAVLFLTAISERFSFVPARILLLSLSTLGLVLGVVIAVTQPITTG